MDEITTLSPSMTTKSVAPFRNDQSERIDYTPAYQVLIQAYIRRRISGVKQQDYSQEKNDG